MRPKLLIVGAAVLFAGTAGILTAGPALAEAHDAGWFVVVKEAVANGRLTARAGETPFNEFAHQHGVAPDALAIGAAVAQPWADIVLSGATTAAQLTSNLAYRVDGPLSEFAQQPEEYWTERSSLPWI